VSSRPTVAILSLAGYCNLESIFRASKVCPESSMEMIADWFKYAGRTFDLRCYENFKKDHRECDEDWSVRWINHQLGHGEQVQ
jgi:hypothetical protein